MAVRHRGGRRDRADQFYRQSRRLRRPYLIGWIKETTGSTTTGLFVLAVLSLIGGVLVFLGRHESQVEFTGAEKP